MARRKAAASPLDSWVTMLIVVRAAAQAAANVVAKTADPTADGNTFSAPLRRAGDASAAVAAYWSTWTMTPDMHDRLLAAYGAKVSKAMTVIPVGGAVSRTDDVWFLDGAWDPQDALAALGFDRMPPAPLPF
jgi:hypothetical protein